MLFIRCKYNGVVFKLLKYNTLTQSYLLRQHTYAPNMCMLRLHKWHCYCAAALF